MRAKPKKLSAKFLRNVAYHEAGHAVAALLSGAKVEKVDIIQDPRYNGGCEWVSGGVSRSSRRSSRRTTKCLTSPKSYLGVLDVIESDIKISLAGFIAELKFSGRRDYMGAYDDFRCAEKDMRKLIPGKTAKVRQIRFEYLQRLYTQTKQLFEDETNWQKVEKLANILLQQKQLDGNDVMEAIR